MCACVMGGTSWHSSRNIHQLMEFKIVMQWRIQDLPEVGAPTLRGRREANLPFSGLGDPSVSQSIDFLDFQSLHSFA